MGWSARAPRRCGPDRRRRRVWALWGIGARSEAVAKQALAEVEASEVSDRPTRGRGGYSLIEMLVVMAILSVVVGGIVTLFASGMNSEADQNRAFRPSRTGGSRSTSSAATSIRPARSRRRRPTTPRLVGHDLLLELTTAHRESTAVTWCTAASGSEVRPLQRIVATSCTGDPEGRGLSDLGERSSPTCRRTRTSSRARPRSGHGLRRDRHTQDAGEHAAAAPCRLDMSRGGRPTVPARRRHRVPQRSAGLRRGIRTC